MINSLFYIKQKRATTTTKSRFFSYYLLNFNHKLLGREEEGDYFVGGGVRISLPQGGWNSLYLNDDDEDGQKIP